MQKALGSDWIRKINQMKNEQKVQQKFPGKDVAKKALKLKELPT